MLQLACVPQESCDTLCNIHIDNLVLYLKLNQRACILSCSPMVLSDVKNKLVSVSISKWYLICNADTPV